MISDWLRRAKPKPTWLALATALHVPSVNCGQLAEKVELMGRNDEQDIMEKGKSSHHQSVHLGQVASDAVVQIGYSENHDHGDTDAELKEPVFRCPCQSCSLDSYLDRGCPQSRQSSFPFLDLSTLDDDNKEDLIQTLSNDTTSMLSRFSDLFNSTCESLNKRNIPTQQVARCALSIDGYESTSKKRLLLSEYTDELRSAKTNDDLFIILKPYMSFFNFELLECIIKNLGSEKNKKELEVYHTNFDEFCRRKVFQVPTHTFDNREQSMHAYAVKHKRTVFAVLITMQDVPNLSDVKNIQRKIATLLGLKSSTLRLHSIEPGSLLLVFSVPSFIAKDILYPLDKIKSQLLKAEGYQIFVPNRSKPVNVRKASVGILENAEEVMPHLKDFSSPKKQYACEYCSFSSKNEDAILVHHSTCSHYPLQCPNHCGKTVRRVDLDNHITTHCPHNNVSGSQRTAPKEAIEFTFYDEAQSAITVEYILAEQVSEIFQIKCPVCLELLREPHQAECCGKNFCIKCIEKMNSENVHTSCPCCKSETFNHFYNKGLQQSLNQIKILCSNHKHGCQWVGEIRSLNRHLNLRPALLEQLTGCNFAEIKCRYCHKLFLRSNISEHQDRECPKRPYECKICMINNATFEDVCESRYPMCDHYPVQCPNKCGITIRHRELDSHLHKECPLSVMDCPNKDNGCTTKVLRKNMDTHLELSNHDGCQFIKVKCRNCNISLQRSCFHAHVCPNDHHARRTQSGWEIILLLFFMFFIMVHFYIQNINFLNKAQKQELYSMKPPERMQSDMHTGKDSHLQQFPNNWENNHMTLDNVIQLPDHNDHNMHKSNHEPSVEFEEELSLMEKVGEPVFPSHTCASPEQTKGKKADSLN